MKIIITLMKNQLLTAHKVMQDFYGWVLGLGSGALTFFAAEKYAFACVFIAVVLDAVFGVIRTNKTGGFILSKLGQQTMFKITAYMSALIMVLMMERLVHDGSAMGIKGAAAIAMACELWSMSASILIVWPDAAFFRIFRHHLRGEMAAKLGEDAAKFLDREEKK